MAEPNFANLFETYRQNVCPAMLEYLANDLGVTAKSLDTMGVGYEFAGPSWVFAERSPSGKIIGLIRRFPDGKKYTISGSKRGLTYIINPDFGKQKDRYVPGRHNWTRVSPSMPCPLCGRTKWCMVSSENIDNPPAVICGNKTGSVCECGEGTYLHILRSEDNRSSSCETVLPQTTLPILIVEGQTDVAAAADLGFVGIGRPSAKSVKMLLKMPLNNRPVVVIGENDAGAGKGGMESAYRTIGKLTANIIQLMPPTGIKDLRAWLKTGLTSDGLIAAIENAPAAPVSEVFEDDVAHTVAKAWMEKELLIDGFPNIRLYKGQWLHYNDGRYQKEVDVLLRGRLYKFLDGKQYQKVDSVGAITLAPYKPSRAKISDIFDALNQWCPIVQDPPTWLDDEPHTDPVNLIPFKNGILDFDAYMEGSIVLLEPTPAFFNMNVVPYDFDETLESKIWDDFLDDIFNGDREKINLLAEWMGYNCVPDMSHEKMMIFTGRPRSGKSTVLEALRHMLGHEQCCESTFQSLCGPFGLQPMVGTLAALIGDAKTPHARESDAALEKLLQIVGGDPVTINRKGISQMPTVQLKCRFTMAMNELPAFADHANALEPRKEDRFLKTKLNKEASVGRLINFALRGLKRLRENKVFTLPKSSSDLTDQFRIISNPIHEFVDECCEFSTDESHRESRNKLKVVTNDLYETWRVWCKCNGRAPGIKPLFFSRFAASYPHIVKNRTRVDGSQRYVYRGVMLTEEAKLKYLGG